MALKLKYIKDSGYDVEDDFLESMNDLGDVNLSIIISDYIDSNVKNYSVNKLTTYVVGGYVFYNNKNVYFVIEILKAPGIMITLTDFQLIEVDEYLDLINLNSYIK
tara:strand:+ start:223 stop:540 length:318 start_codon:yes stop_codon:yes gene_type:complete